MRFNTVAVQPLTPIQSWFILVRKEKSKQWRITTTETETHIIYLFADRKTGINMGTSEFKGTGKILSVLNTD